MQSELERLEVETILAGDHQLGVEHAALGELLFQRGDNFGEVAVERLFVTALNEHLVAVAKDQRAEAVPFWFKDPCFARRQLADAIGEHGEYGRVDREVHARMVSELLSLVIPSLCAPEARFLSKMKDEAARRTRFRACRSFPFWSSVHYRCSTGLRSPRL